MGRHQVHGEDGGDDVGDSTAVTARLGEPGEAAERSPGPEPSRRGRRAVPDDAEADDEHPGRALLARLLAEASERGAARGEGEPDGAGVRGAGEAQEAEGAEEVEHGAPVAEVAAVAPGVQVDSGPARRRQSGTSADLRLLREDGRLRLRCAVAALAPFAVFTAILLGLRRADVYLVWVWIPTVTAGVLVGALLDRAHARRSSASPGSRTGTVGVLPGLAREGEQALGDTFAADRADVSAAETVQLPAREERDDSARKAG